MRPATDVLMRPPLLVSHPIPRPVGHAPKNRTWDSTTGQWVTSDVDEAIPVIFKRPVGAPKRNHSWNEDNGTWDLLTSASAVPATVEVKRPRGPAPKGMQWNTQSGVWVSIVAIVNESSGTAVISRPRGPTPFGMRWDGVSGSWVEVTAGSGSAPVELQPDDSEIERMGRSAGGAGKFRNQWSVSFPFLIVVKSTADSSEASICSSEAGASCSGCASCSAMRCSDCVIKRRENVFGFESWLLKFQEKCGCSNFILGPAFGSRTTDVQTSLR